MFENLHKRILLIRSPRHHTSHHLFPQYSLNIGHLHEHLSPFCPVSVWPFLLTVCLDPQGGSVIGQRKWSLNSDLRANRGEISHFLKTKSSCFLRWFAHQSFTRQRYHLNKIKSHICEGKPLCFSPYRVGIHSVNSI